MTSEKPANRNTDPCITFLTAEKFLDEDDNTFIIASAVSTPRLQNFLDNDEKFTDKAAVSLDEIFAPFSSSSGTSPIVPAFAHLEYSSGLYTEISSLDPKIRPFTYPSGYQGHYGIIPTYDSGIQQSSEDIYDNTSWQDTEVRSIGLKLPMFAVGWGATIESVPLPNKKNDVYVEYSGLGLTSNQEKFQFADNYQNRPELWKAGPVDIRWDGYRKMWIAAPEMKVGYALEEIPVCSGRYSDLPFTSGFIDLAFGRGYEYQTLTRQNATDPDPACRLLIFNRSMSMTIQSGALVIATYTDNGEYLPIFVDCAPDDSFENI